MTAIAARIARHGRRQTGPGTWVVELCPGYFAAAGHAYATAWRAWQWLRPRLGWAEVPWHAVRGALRERPTGGRWGRHLVVTEDVLAAAASLAELCGEADAIGGGPVRRVDVTRRDAAGRAWAVCPWHADDRDPSLLMNPSGSAWCFGCGSLGRWTAVDVDHADVCGPLDRSGRGTHPTTQVPDPRVTIRGAGEVPRRGGTGRGDPGEGEAHGRAPGPRGEAVELRAGRRAGAWGLRGLDPLEAVLAADAEAAEAIPGWTAEDRWLRLDPSRPTAWMQTPRGRWAPAAWRTTAAAWVVVDLDPRAREAPRCPEGAVPWSAVDAVAHAAPEAPWAVAMGAAIRARLAEDPGRWSGRWVLLRTSLGGLHVAAELREAAPTSAWRGALGRAARALGAWLEGIAAEAGFDVAADPQSWRPGRAVRRPGHRAETRDGLGWVVRVAAHGG